MNYTIFTFFCKSDKKYRTLESNCIQCNLLWKVFFKTISSLLKQDISVAINGN